MRSSNFRNAFTMVELIFVVVVIGILAAVALPRFGDAADSAYLAKAQSEVATVRSTLATERQKRVLRGDFTDITDLALTGTNAASTGNAFDHFSADQDGENTPIFQYPVRACLGTGRACWVRNSATSYSFRFLDTTDGQADFILQNNRFDCDDNGGSNTVMTAKCKKITL